jgi:hypothetical protein
MLMKLEFSRRIFEKSSNFMKICPLGTELFHADRRLDGQTDGRNEANSQHSDQQNAQFSFLDIYITISH